LNVFQTHYGEEDFEKTKIQKGKEYEVFSGTRLGVQKELTV
jgi:hypothetical protein